MKQRKAAASTAAAAGLAILLGAVALLYTYYTNVATGADFSSMSTTLSSQNDQIFSMRSSLSTQSAEIGALQANVSSLQTSLTALQAKLVAVSGLLNSTQATDSAALLRLSAEEQSLNSTLQTLKNELAAATAPALLQDAGSTCSYACAAGSTNATFSSAVRSGDMLLVTIVSDDLTNLVVTDSLGTRLSLAASATTSPMCTSNSGSCQADIYWGLLPASGSDTIAVSEGASTRALRVQAWEFAGVNSVESTAVCQPSCASTAYPSSAILIATARDVTGAGTGFGWFPYPVSSVAGTEYQITSSSGSTTFPFSASVNDVEAAVVLAKTS